MYCYFCDKKIEKYKVFRIFSGMKKVCGQCHSIHKLLRGHTKEAIIKMINAMDKHTCYTCNNFNKHNEDYCFRHMYTGVITHNKEYPFTYANHNCGKYSLNEKSI